MLHRLPRNRYGKILLLGSLCLVLQQISVPYVLHLMGGTQAGASLLHLHTALLLAIAMLERDRWVLVGAYAMTTLGWLVRARLAGYEPVYMMVGATAAVVGYAWVVYCARWMGWPKPEGQARVQRRDLIPFAMIGLLVFPTGMTLLVGLSTLSMSAEQQMSSVLQTWFAKHFGVVVLTFPLVLAWCERGYSGARRRPIGWLWPLLLMLGVFTSIWLSLRAQSTFVGSHEGAVVLMDYRFTVFAAVAWCMLRLQPRHSMPLLSAVMFVLVCTLAGTAERSGSPLGFINLLHLALELGILLIAMLFYLVISRDGRELSERLVAEAHSDSATGLPNLKALMHRIQRDPPRRREVGYLLLDQVDSLRTGFGLDSQALAMSALAARLDDLVEPYYVGTGQFALLPLNNDDPGERQLWDSLVARVEQAEIDVGEQRLRLLPYLGVSSYPIASREAINVALLTSSHLSFEAKQHNEVRPQYDQKDNPALQEAQRQQRYEAVEALACLRSERVVLYFQPIVSLRGFTDGQQADAWVRGEVLCRLRGEKDELISPAHFMRAIEAAGRGVELDLAVLKVLFRQLCASPEALPHFERISINLTGQSVASDSFQQQLRDLLADSPLPLDRLCFEITETAAISSTVLASQFLDELRDQGCSIAIDDFGVGMQSFERLKKLPVDVIKIDGSFVRNVAQRGEDYALVQASVAVAKAFGAQTVAEFVEDQATVACLREIGVDWIQGYLVSPPQPLSEVLARSRRSG